MSRVMAFDYESASVWLRPHAGYMKIYNLYSRDPGKGHATKLMNAVVEHADKVGFDLYLVAKQYGNARGLTDKQLIAFYGRFGFERLEGAPEFVMVRNQRKPSQKLHGL